MFRTLSDLLWTDGSSVELITRSGSLTLWILLEGFLLETAERRMFAGKMLSFDWMRGLITFKLLRGRRQSCLFRPDSVLMRVNLPHPVSSVTHRGPPPLAPPPLSCTQTFANFPKQEKMESWRDGMGKSGVSRRPAFGVSSNMDEACRRHVPECICDVVCQLRHVEVMMDRHEDLLLQRGGGWW